MCSNTCVKQICKAWSLWNEFFLFVLLTSTVLLSHTLAQSLIPWGQETRLTAISWGKTCGDSGGEGESWEVVSVTSCHFWFPQARDRMSEHSTLDPSTLTEVPQKEAQHYFQECSWKTKARLEQEMGGEESQRIQHPWPFQHKEWIQAYRLRGV